MTQNSSEKSWKSVLDRLEVRGTVLVASEGINGTVSGSRDGIDGMLTHLRAQRGFSDLEHKESISEKCPFLRNKGAPEERDRHIGYPRR